MGVTINLRRAHMVLLSHPSLVLVTLVLTAIGQTHAAAFHPTWLRASGMSSIHMQATGGLAAISMEDNLLPKKKGILKRLKNFIVGEPLEEGVTIRDIVPSRRSSDTASWEGADKPVSDYMNTDLVTLCPEQSLSDAGRVLTEKAVTGAPVVDPSGKLVGVLSRKDLLFKIAGRGSLKGVQEGGARSERYMENTMRLRKLEAEVVGRAMTPFPISLTPTATMQEAAALMLRRNLNRVLITDPETQKLVGIVSSTDIFRLAFEGSSTWK